MHGTVALLGIFNHLFCLFTVFSMDDTKCPRSPSPMQTQEISSDFGTSENVGKLLA